MPTSVGPNTKGEENLVFGYDLGDVQNSYKGEPTENLFGAPEDYIANLQLQGIASVEPNAGYAPDGTYTATKLTFYTGDNLVGSFGKYPSLSGETAGKRFTVSFWEKNIDIDQTAQAFTPSIEGYVASPGTGSGHASIVSNTTAFNRTLTSEWQYREAVYNINQNDATAFYLRIYRDTSTSAGTGSLLIWQPQFEEKDHPTQHTEGIRSATEGLVDLTGNSTLDLSNVSFDSNAQIEFDGTDDWLNAPVTLNAGNFTYETVMKQYGSTSYTIFSAGTGNPSSGGTNVQAFVNSSGGLINLYAPVGASGWNTGTYDNTGNFTATSNVNYHIVVVNLNTTWKIYVNGNLVGDIDSFVPTVGNSVGVARSAMQAANDKNSKVSLTKIYNRALTASEIKANYNAVKGRFNI